MSSHYRQYSHDSGEFIATPEGLHQPATQIHLSSHGPRQPTSLPMDADMTDRVERYDIRPLPVPVDDAFRYSNYELDDASTLPTSSNSMNGSISPRLPSYSSEPSSVDHGNLHVRKNSFKGHPHSNTNSQRTSGTVVDSHSVNDSHNSIKGRHISFANAEYPLKIIEDDDIVEESIQIADSDPSAETTTMKRHRWGTQRRKNRSVKRSRSLFSRHPSAADQRKSSKDSAENSTAKSSTDVDGEDSVPQRQIYVNIPLPDRMIDPESGAPLTNYPRNKIRTTKYTPLSFVPKNLFFQFQNVANIYFLFIVILGAFSIFGVASAGMAAVPIIVIVVLTGIKDAIEDYRRTLLDLEVNNTRTQILSEWHNFNVTDENVSLWRRFKKANTRLMVRTYRMIKNSKSKNKSVADSQDNIEDPFSNSLAVSSTINSVYTVHNPEDSYYMRELDEYGKDTNKSESNPFEDAAYEYGKPIQDSVVNPNLHVPGKAKFKRDYWKNVKVGDIVRIGNNDEIPSDIVILATSDSDRACYVETKNLDGETNLKVRQSLKCGEGIKHSTDCERSQFWIESEGPHANLYSYNGVAKWVSQSEDSANEVKSEPISINNVLLRGCTLRNTKWVIGVTLFTGTDTKIMLNAGITPTKRSRISRELNISVIYNFGILFILCFVCGLVNGIFWATDGTSASLFEYGSAGGSTPPIAGIVTFFAAIILYQSLVPVSLYISIEIVKTIQAFFIYSDVKMYYEPIDYPCTPKSWNISDDLGQIEYVFSDKTGTLTQNVMEFKKCTINGVAYGKAYTEALAGMRKRQGIDVAEEGARMRVDIQNDKVTMIDNLRSIDDNPQLIDDELTFISSKFVKDLKGESGKEQENANKHFMLALALCHSVIAERSKHANGRVEFKAQSPDEAALVATARDVGFSFLERTNKGVIVDVQGTEQEYQILNTLEFNSTRKRMSAIVKLSGKGPGAKERILLICKGADSVIYSRLKPGSTEELCRVTAIHLEEFANEGLRTLCIAERELPLDEYQDWNKRHELASASLVNREEKMEEVADSIERSLSLLGGTAIEDRLQDGVPDSISLLGQAGIKLWVLTGDKVETAINIGFSCNLLDSSMELLILRSDDLSVDAVDKMITEHLMNHFGIKGSQDELETAKLDHSPPSSQFAVVIDGDTLKVALDDAIKIKFLLLCKQCKSVLCCRVSPAQKAAVVRLVKTTLGVMCVSIGDGANDVAMIQEADVGVGIAGEEGRQAVMSSDYAIGQFRFLTRLLLTHGRWSYKRLAEMIPNFFYKNLVFTMSLFWYGIFGNFDAAYLFEYTYLMFFNLAFTSLPVIFMGVLDQDVNDKISMLEPGLYKRGILRLEWSQKKFW